MCFTRGIEHVHAGVFFEEGGCDCPADPGGAAADEYDIARHRVQRKWLMSVCSGIVAASDSGTVDSFPESTQFRRST